MVGERLSLQPLMTQLRIPREKLLAISSDRINEKEIKNLALAETGLLARLIVANARMQSKIYRLLSPDQQKSSTISNEPRDHPQSKVSRLKQADCHTSFERQRISLKSRAKRLI